MCIHGPKMAMSMLTAAYALTLASSAGALAAAPPAPALAGRYDMQGVMSAVGRLSWSVASTLGFAPEDGADDGAPSDSADRILDTLNSTFGRVVLRQLFHAVDRDRDGQLNLAEALVGLRRIPGLENAPSVRLEQAAKRGDTNSDAHVSLEEVLGAPRAISRPIVELALSAFAAPAADAR